MLLLVGAEVRDRGVGLDDLRSRAGSCTSRSKRMYLSRRANVGRSGRDVGGAGALLVGAIVHDGLVEDHEDVAVLS